MSIVPIIDLSPLFIEYGNDADKIAAELAVAKLIGEACSNVGFFVITGHGIDSSVVDNAWTATTAFFNLPLEEKIKHIFPQEVNPFGYTALGSEILSSGKAVETMQQHEHGHEEQAVAAPDLKEMYSLGPEDPRAGFPPRVLPSEPACFAEAMPAYYRTLNQLAHRILRCFSLALGLDNPDFFEQFCDRHASALRAIHYPALPPSTQILPGQLRASAHTDYGTITILRADGPGLQVSKDLDPPQWHEVPFVPHAFVINLGDLMRRWTNDQWLSTLHRVIIPVDEECRRRRQSLAFFHNVNRDANIEVLLRHPGELPKHPSIIAGDFLLQKHLASMGKKG